MLKKLALLLLLALTSCNFLDPFLPTLPPTLTVPSLTPNFTATDTATPTLVLSDTPTLTMTTTQGVTLTPLPPSPTLTLLPFTETAALPTQAVWAYRVQAFTPKQMSNFAHPAQACQWMSVAGQVFDAYSNPVLNLVVHVTGTLNGQPFDQIGMTGVAQEYGPGGYEIKLADKAIDSTGALTIQLLDLEAHPLSKILPFNTSADCSRNVTLINFAP